MLHTIKQDITNISEIADSFMILHVVNCKKKLSKGVGLKIRSAYEGVYENYIQHFDVAAKYKREVLGSASFVKVTPTGGWVSNLFAQDDYGNDGQRYLNYEALATSLETVVAYRNGTFREGKQIEGSIYVPYKMGCGLAGGSWKIVSAMLDEYLKDVVICKWD